MAYNVSQEFREQCYSGESLYSCRLIIGGNTIPIEQIASITISSPIVDSNSETFYIGTFISQKLTIEFKNLDGIDTTSGTNVELYISQNVNGVDIEVPIGKYLIDESPENYYKSSKIDCLDYAIKFATNVDYSPSFVDGKTTIDNLLQWLCTYYGVTLGNYPNTNGNVEIGTYDSTVSGKRWISYIAEIKGCNAKMDRLGQLTLVPIKSSPAVTIDALKSASWELGEKFEISKVTFFDAIRNYTYGDDSENTLFIRQDNPFVIDTNVVQNIYNVVKDLQIWSLTCENYGDISLDAWDIIHYTLGDEDYYTLNNNTITYAMTIMSKIETKIPTKQQEVTTNVVGGNEQQQIRRLRTEVNTIDNTITLQAQQIATNTSNISTNTSNISTLNTNLNGLSASFTDFYDNEYIVEVANLQDQIDGAIQFWNGPAIPTLNNYPANQWTTEADRNNHRADIYTVIEDVEGELKQGKSYRFDKVGNTWQWVELTDNELSAVQALAQQALDKSNANEQDIADLNDELSNPTTTLSGTSFDIEDALDQPLQDFKMYGNTYQDGTPTPSSPQPIHNVSGDNTIEICGKNLFNAQIEEGTYGNATYSVASDGLITQSATDNSAWNINQNRVFYLNAGTYTISILGTYRYLQVRNLTDNNDAVLTGNNSATFTLNDRKALAIKTYGTSSSITYPISYYIQLEKGNEVTTYEAYTGQSQLISLGVDMPSGYTRLDYIESSGTQYIDTGISPTLNTGVKIKASLINENNSDKILFGSRVGSNRFWFDFDGTQTPPNFMYGFGSYYQAGTYSLNTDYDITFNYNGDKKLIINNNTYSMSGSPDYSSSVPIYIFKANYSSAFAGNFKVYYCQIYEGTTKVRDLIPCKRNSDSAIGMLDLKHNVFYENQGTGTFTYGTEFVNGIELNKIGNYQDYIYKTDKWYLHKEIGKAVLNGSENWMYSSSLGAMYLSNYMKAIDNDLIGCYSNKYKATTRNNYNVSNYTIYGNSSGVLSIRDTNYTIASDFKTYLQTANVIVYYILNAPTDTEITDTTLLEQLDNLMTIPLIKDLTHIIITPNDLTPTLDIEYLRNTSINENFVRQPQLESYYTKVETDAQIEISSSQIQSTVSELQTQVDSNGNAISSVSNQVQTLQTSTSFEINAVNQRIDNGVEIVQNGLVRVDGNGINTSRADETFNTQITNKTFEIRDSDTELTFIGYDTNEQRTVARIDTLESKRATIGVHRTEVITRNGKKRTAGFYVGGGN